MVMSWIWSGLILISLFCGAVTGNIDALSAAAMRGAQSGITLALSIAGAVCLWSGIGRLMTAAGITRWLALLLQPLLHLLFPEARKDKELAGSLSANICANLLGLGNAATPMGIAAAKRLKQAGSDSATDSLCRLIVLNTASIQLLPTNVAAVRAALGCAVPFDILPAVWTTSLLSAGLGIVAAWIMGKVWRS